MKINKIYLLYALFCFSLTCLSATAQKTAGNWPATNWSHSTKNCRYLLSTPAQCKWQLIELASSLEGTIVWYDRAQKNEKTLYAASVAIVKTGNDLLRVLLLGNYDGCKPGQHIKIVQDKEPKVDVTVPLDREYYLSQEKKGAKPVCRINSYDETLLKTVWGKLVN